MSKLKNCNNDPRQCNPEDLLKLVFKSFGKYTFHQFKKVRVCLNFVFGGKNDEFFDLTKRIFEEIAIAIVEKIVAVRVKKTNFVIQRMNFKHTLNS